MFYWAKTKHEDGKRAALRIYFSVVCLLFQGRAVTARVSWSVSLQGQGQLIRLKETNHLLPASSEGCQRSSCETVRL